MKKLLLAIALIAVVGVATEMEARLFRRGCNDGSCSRPVRGCHKKRCHKKACAPKKSCKKVCDECETCPQSHEVIRQPENCRCIEKTWCRLVTPEKTVTIPAQYEKVTCVTNISESCCVTKDGCTEADYNMHPNLSEAPADVHSALANANVK